MSKPQAKQASQRDRREDQPPQKDEMLAYEAIARAQLEFAQRDGRPLVFAVKRQ